MSPEFDKIRKNELIPLTHGGNDGRKISVRQLLRNTTQMFCVNANAQYVRIVYSYIVHNKHLSAPYQAALLFVLIWAPDISPLTVGLMSNGCIS